LRLLLDEQHDRGIAERLREHGHDVIAVTERSGLRQLIDYELLRAAAAERRAVVTEDVRDFALAHRAHLERGETHFGIIFTSSRRFPRVKSARRQLVAALRRFLEEHPQDDELSCLVYWL
jgi:predicted nuclease of predicted toxin-antitoxin system